MIVIMKICLAGVDPHHARVWSTGKGRLKVAESPALITTVALERLKQ